MPGMWSVNRPPLGTVARSGNAVNKKRAKHPATGPAPSQRATTSPEAEVPRVTMHLLPGWARTWQQAHGQIVVISKVMTTVVPLGIL